jgi:hypothetical protein
MTMLSCVINSERAIMVNIQIIRIFSRMRELLVPNRDILQKLLNLESKGIDHDKKINLIFKYLEKLRKSEAEKQDVKQRPRIRFKP